MAKGQRRSNREAKKPKKPVPGPPRNGVAAAFTPATGMTPKLPPKRP